MSCEGKSAFVDQCPITLPQLRAKGLRVRPNGRVITGFFILDLVAEPDRVRTKAAIFLE